MTESPTPIHETVREHYAERIKSSASCCGPSDCCSTESRLYPVDLLATLPSDVSSTSYGCGDPITLASLKPGQTVLDLGSGAGLDCLLAAQKVGPEGRVIGVDMTPEMIERAQANAKRVNASNVEFRQAILKTCPWKATRWMSSSRTASSTFLHIKPKCSPRLFACLRRAANSPSPTSSLMVLCLNPSSKV